MNEEEINIKISRINIKTETFCAAWENQLFCVDVCEDAEEISAWLYRPNYGVKSFMFGYKVSDISRDEFLDCVFSNLPDYAEDYDEEYRE